MIQLQESEANHVLPPAPSRELLEQFESQQQDGGQPAFAGDSTSQPLDPSAQVQQIFSTEQDESIDYSQQKTQEFLQCQALIYEEEEEHQLCDLGAFDIALAQNTNECSSDLIRDKIDFPLDQRTQIRDQLQSTRTREEQTELRAPKIMASQSAVKPDVSLVSQCPEHVPSPISAAGDTTARQPIGTGAPDSTRLIQIDLAPMLKDKGSRTRNKENKLPRRQAPTKRQESRKKERSKSGGASKPAKDVNKKKAPSKKMTATIVPPARTPALPLPAKPKQIEVSASQLQLSSQRCHTSSQLQSTPMRSSLGCNSSRGAATVSGFDPSVHTPRYLEPPGGYPPANIDSVNKLRKSLKSKRSRTPLLLVSSSKKEPASIQHRTSVGWRKPSTGKTATDYKQKDGSPNPLKETKFQTLAASQPLNLERDSLTQQDKHMEVSHFSSPRALSLTPKAGFDASAAQQLEQLSAQELASFIEDLVKIKTKIARFPWLEQIALNTLKTEASLAKRTNE